MDAVVTSVNYADYLAHSLKANRPHFDHIVVVTTPNSQDSRVAFANGCNVVETNVFTANGARFAKYAGIEAGLDVIGRRGWLTILDADIVLPSDWEWGDLEIGNLYGPHRKMCRTYPPPPESEWEALDTYVTPFHRKHPAGPVETWFLGYMHTFHGKDPVLGDPPWYGNWKTASGGDMEMFMKWPAEKRIRFKQHVLHLGEERKNWSGRVTPQYGG